MIFPVLYAIAVWGIAMYWRRRWPAFVGVALGIAGLFLLYRLVRAWSDHFTAYQHAIILFWPYTVLVGVIGTYIACLPRRVGETHCKNCGYDLGGLNPLNLSCPECGSEWRGLGSGREAPLQPLIPIPMGPPKKRKVKPRR